MLPSPPLAVLVIPANRYHKVPNGNLCLCFHDETLHRFPPPPPPDANNQNDHFSPAHTPPGPAPYPALGPHRPVHLYQPLAGPIPSTSNNYPPALPAGIPLNRSTPILRQFRPQENRPSATSEENRKRSIARTAGKSKKRTQVARTVEEPLSSRPVNKDVSILLFPLHVGCVLFVPIHDTHMDSPNPSSQLSEFPTWIVENLHPGKPRFEIPNGKFGSFSQQMFDIGLVFDVSFTDDELLQPNWSLFDRKIEDGISSLQAEIQLPPRPDKLSLSANSTLWTFVKCLTKQARGNVERKYLLDHADPLSSSQWTLDHLTKTLSVTNPISRPGSNAIPERLIIIGV